MVSSGFVCGFSAFVFFCVTCPVLVSSVVDVIREGVLIIGDRREQQALLQRECASGSVVHRFLQDAAADAETQASASAEKQALKHIQQQQRHHPADGRLTSGSKNPSF